ncbi:MAG TPA: AAA family ATPase [Candidatus Saccharimonadales bacterium]|nr:AAA family ATPase [Candidatus Saccharimonadales bacterium]
MPKVFITGSGGVGKSTIIQRLQERGFTAYDTDDMPGVTRLENLVGEHVDWPEDYVDWNKYRWNWQRTAIEKLLASSETVFLGAHPSNWADFVHVFDVMIVLSIDTKTHEHRLRTRNTHTYGQGEQNIREQMYAQNQERAAFLAAGAIEVANNHSVDTVVDEILSIAHVDQ